jgi:hypothetical protein
MDKLHTIGGHVIERSIVGMTMALGIMWKDLIVYYFGFGGAMSFALVVTLTLIVAFILAMLPEHFVPKKSL